MVKNLLRSEKLLFFLREGGKGGRKKKCEEKFLIPDLSALVICVNDQNFLGSQNKMDLLQYILNLLFSFRQLLEEMIVKNNFSAEKVMWENILMMIGSGSRSSRAQHCTS